MVSCELGLNRLMLFTADINHVRSAGITLLISAVLILQPDQLPLEDTVVVCRYISNPLLIDGLKSFRGILISFMHYFGGMCYNR